MTVPLSWYSSNVMSNVTWRTLERRLSRSTQTTFFAPKRVYIFDRFWPKFHGQYPHQNCMCPKPHCWQVGVPPPLFKKYEIPLLSRIGISHGDRSTCSGSSVVKLYVKCVMIIQNRLEVDMFCRATSQNNPQLFFSFFLSKKFSNGNFQNLFGGMTRAHTPRVVSEYEPQRTKTREVRAVNRCSVHFCSSRYPLGPSGIL